MVDIRFPNDLTKPSEFKEEFLKSALAEGYAVEQLINGETFIRMTSKYFNELGDYIKLHPKELCREYWECLVDETKNCDIMTFVKRFCFTHTTIKKLTKNEVDFCEYIGEELSG